MDRRACIDPFMAWRGWMAFGAVAALLFAAAPADAADPGTEERARLSTLLRAGAEAARAKNWDTCIEAYSAAAAIEDAATTLGELGLCEEAAGRNAAAHPHLLRARDAAKAGADARAKQYQAAFERVTERVAILIVTVEPTDARVILDGHPLGPADGRGVAVEPGTHTLAARHEGYEDLVVKRTVSAHDLPNVHLRLLPKPRATPARGPVKASPEASERAPTWYAPALSWRGVFVGLTYASAATALASGGTAIGLELDRSSIGGKLPRDACNPANPTRPPPSTCAAVRERRLQRDTAVDVTIVAAIGTGALAAAAGLALSLEPRGAKVSIAPAAGAHGGGVMISGAW